MICHHCGFEDIAETNFCIKCGYRKKSTTEPNLNTEQLDGRKTNRPTNKPPVRRTFNQTAEIRPIFKKLKIGVGALLGIAGALLGIVIFNGVKGYKATAETAEYTRYIEQVMAATVIEQEGLAALDKLQIQEDILPDKSIADSLDTQVISKLQKAFDDFKRIQIPSNDRSIKIHSTLIAIFISRIDAAKTVSEGVRKQEKYLVSSGINRWKAADEDYGALVKEMEQYKSTPHATK